MVNVVSNALNAQTLSRSVLKRFHYVTHKQPRYQNRSVWKEYKQGNVTKHPPTPPVQHAALSFHGDYKFAVFFSYL